MTSQRMRSMRVSRGTIGVLRSQGRQGDGTPSACETRNVTVSDNANLSFGSAGIISRMQPDEEIIKRWRGSVPFWEKHRNIIRGMFAPITQALMEDAGIGRHDSVLDVATGPGEPALSVAALAGPNGKVFGVDAIQGMVTAARGEAERLGLKNAKFDVALANDLPFAADTFDAVISRFGGMVF